MLTGPHPSSTCQARPPSDSHMGPGTEEGKAGEAEAGLGWGAVWGVWGGWCAGVLMAADVWSALPVGGPCPLGSHSPAEEAGSRYKRCLPRWFMAALGGHSLP